jgi:tRNA(Ile)-lysidine synthase
MRARAGRYGRPLLEIRRATTEAACRALGLDYWDDPHNADRALQRVRLRREVLPLLEDVLQGGVSEALARTAAQLQDDDDALRDWALSAACQAETEAGLDVTAVAALPRAVRTRLLRAWLLGGGADEVRAEHIERIDALVTDWHGQGAIQLPGRVEVRRVSARLVLESPTPGSLS